MKIFKYKSLKSTNETAKEILIDKAVISADMQTEGKGRPGKSFFSPEGGIYMSIMLKSDLSDAVYLSAAVAVAVCRAIINLTDISPEIKWINDIYIGGKKAGGILIENFRGFAIIGIGLNLKNQDFPDDIDAVSLNSDIPKDIFINEIAEQVFNIIENRDFILEYRKLSNVIGKEIIVYENSGNYNAMVIDISDIGELIIRKDGEVKVLNSTATTIRRMT